MKQAANMTTTIYGDSVCTLSILCQYTPVIRLAVPTPKAPGGLVGPRRVELVVILHPRTALEGRAG
jgi:hypothetical protein